MSALRLIHDRPKAKTPLEIELEAENAVLRKENADLRRDQARAREWATLMKAAVNRSPWPSGR